MKKPFGLIYKATNKVNGKVYIGQTKKGLKSRRYKHERDKRDMAIVNAINKYGRRNFKWSVLKYCNSREDLNRMEIFYIKKYNSFTDGYNRTRGGLYADHSEAVRHKISQSKIGKKRPPFSRAARIAMSNGHLGNKIPKSVRSKMSKNGSFWWLLIFPDGSRKVIKNLYKYCNNNGLNPSAMVAVSKGNRRHHKNYRCKRLYDIEIRRMECL